ncbi:MAG: 6-carboxytetrahydropterin synthase [Microscillaceae bacterium]|jgi:6-pyruvoyltetrahydropterin/6-carboxytetrahydropterin synthase|nr:6-carboxytetrahydropterin synthase [Microscillaceae bacterium]
MVYICRKENFNAAHRVYNPKWSKAQNDDVFGPCANEYYHGHNFELIVTVKGKPQPETGWVMDMKKLGQLVRREVTDKLDHKNLNMDVDFLAGKIPTCEVLIIEIWKILAPKISAITDRQAQLHSLKLYETANNFVEYFGEE